MACTFSTSNGHRIVQKWSERGVLCTFLLPNVLRATTACTFSTSQLPKVARTCANLSMFHQNVLRATTACTFLIPQLLKLLRSRGVFTLLASKCASCHNGVHFFHIPTSESAPRITCFATFHLETCFAPQRHELFQHLNFQKWSEHDVF